MDAPRLLGRIALGRNRSLFTRNSFVGEPKIVAGSSWQRKNALADDDQTMIKSDYHLSSYVDPAL
jgi:hypothetical protein